MTIPGTAPENPSPPESSAGSGVMVACGNFFFRFRNALFPAVFVLLLLLTRPAQFLGDPGWDRFAIGAGILIALAGQAVRLFVIGYAYIVRGGRNRKVYADDLVVAGVYAHSRNPMYVGNFLITVGLGVAYGSPWVYIVVIPFFTFVYLAIVFAEEAYLRSKFGSDYDHYRDSVPRFWPRFKGLRETLHGHPYDWRKVLVKEYGTVFGTLAGIVTILIAKRWWIYGYESSRALITILASLYIPLLVFYVIVRWLKKTGRLRPAQSPAAPELRGE